MPITMKNIIYLFLLLPSVLLSQKFIHLDSLKQYQTIEYILDTKDIYRIDKKINVYNVFISKDNILLFSILPNLEKETIFEKKEKKMENWQKIDIEKIKNQILTTKQIAKIVDEWSIDNNPEMKTMNYNLLKQINGIYYISQHCLIEFFNISNLKFPLISSYGIINIEDKKVTIKQMEKSFKEQFPDIPFIMDVREDNFLQNITNPYEYRNYLSKEIIVKDEKAYQFWTFDGWWIHDGYNVYRGIDRFLFIPNKGIVGGSYDFYFRLKPKISTNDYYTASSDNLWDNIINEKIMVADELK